MIDQERIALDIISNMSVGQTLKVSDVAKRNPDNFVYCVARLIHCGWDEFEFNSDCTEITRFDKIDWNDRN